ncbi:hypothetical protein [Marinobacterium rhizophilum]|uniref:VanZ like protein n=1 Tax=Marinobacterium rhizophilum TaxID=420402 RepID=A0ABY5HEH4_9GAMM|nr:hypothetical protein [Marinobacterium rhizophilum]UTW10628.1 hypothetical protein KDW95_15175 [Marinobacterium rhizophilum]
MAQFYNLRMFIFLCCCACLLYGIFRPAGPPDLFDQSDKVKHLLAFASLSFTGRLAFPRSNIMLFWGLMLPLAVVLEWIQHWVQPSRVLSHLDAIANVTGAVIGGMFWGLLYKRARWIKSW